MGKIIKKRVEYGGSSNSAENIKYDDTKNVKEAINEVGNLLGNTDISAIGDGTVTGGLNALNSNLDTQGLTNLWDKGNKTNTFINAQGDYISAADWITSTDIKVNGGDKIGIYGVSASNIVSLKIMNANKENIWLPIQSLSDCEITLPKDARYISICTEKEKESEAKVYVLLHNMVSNINSNLVDQKMLGWTVPSECPIQNYVDSDGVFHQIVGRVDLGSLDFEYSASDGWFQAVFITKYKDTAYCNKYITNDYNQKKDKTISNPGMYIVVIDSSYTDETVFKSAMQGVYLYYGLTEEILIKVDGNEAVTKLNSNLSELGVVANSKASREFDVTTSQNASVSIPTKSRIGLFVATNAYEISLGIYGEFSGDFSISWITNQLNCSYSSKKITIPSEYTRYLFIYGGV